VAALAATAFVIAYKLLPLQTPGPLFPTTC